MISITNKMTREEMIAALAQGDSAAAQVLVQLAENASKIDPTIYKGYVGLFYCFDVHGIRGAKIARLYHDVCAGSLVKTIACVYGMHLDLISEADVHDAINGMRPLDTYRVLALVRSRDPGFAAVYFCKNPPARCLPRPF